MKLKWILLFACLFVTGCGESTEVEKTPDPDSSAEVTATEPKKSDAQLAYEAADKEFTESRESFIKKLRALPQDERGEFISKNAPDASKYADRFMSIADENPDDPAAFDSLLWVASNRVGGEKEAKAFRVLFDKHIDNEGMKDICIGLMYSPKPKQSEGRLKMLIEKSPYDQVKAMATFALANVYQRMKEPTVEESEILSLYRTLESEYGDLKIHEKSKETFAAMAKSSIFEIENLGIGKVAPDIEGEDLEGVAFKLSDYRGKVVVLDFWGDW